MIPANEVLDALIANMRLLPGLLQAVGGDAQKIYAYHDQYPERTELSAAVLEMVPPAIMVAWAVDDYGDFDGDTRKWRHRFQGFVRASEGLVDDDPRDYYAVWNHLINDIHPVHSQPFFNCEVRADCYPMDASIRRVRNAPGFPDTFQLSIDITEKF